jgi:hypothetical protein
LLGILFLDCEGSEFLSPMLLQQPTTGSISLTSRECSPEEPPLWNVHFLFVFVMVYDIYLYYGHWAWPLNHSADFNDSVQCGLLLLLLLLLPFVSDSFGGS